MRQSKLNDFFISNTPEPPPKPIQPASSAKETLLPLFVRPIPDAPKYQKQLEEEFALIDQNNFAPVFIQVKTIISLMEELGKTTGHPILHVIRGSAGSSLVCFLLGITHIDPLLHGIQLARFMNKGRKDMPDIDIDVPYNRREEIYAKIAETWPGMVARISNHVKYSQKTAMREAIQEVLGVSVMPASLRKREFKLASLLPEKEDQEAAKALAKEKLGQLKHYSKHSGGIVIFEEAGEVPRDLVLQHIEANGQPMVQIKLNKDETEDAGYIKIDLLSNRGLAQIAEICPERPFTQYPVRDTATERIFEKGWTIGITFGESRGMRKLFMEMKPQRIKDIAIALALIRPAAAAEGRKQEFLQKWKVVEHNNNPLLLPIVFDDDAIQKIRLALQCDASDADKWRKAFAKGNAQKRIEFRQKMYAMGHSRDIVDRVVDDLNQLIYYSFCKSHAVSYAQLVWALGYWKAHRPHAFWAAALNHCHSEYRKWVHYREARCAGLLLSREPPPYRVGVRGGQPALIAKTMEQPLLHPLQPVEEYKQLGYWTAEEFLPGCGLWKDAQQRLDGKVPVTFRGVIACGRTVSRDSTTCTLICIGVQNREYIDIVIPDVARGDLFRYACLEGAGFLQERVTGQQVEVTKVRGISLSALH